MPDIETPEPFEQHMFAPLTAVRPQPTTKESLLGPGLLAAHQLGSLFVDEGVPALPPFNTYELFVPELSLLIAEEMETLSYPAAELPAREFRQPESTLAARPTAEPTRPEPPKQERDVQAFVMAVRALIAKERLVAARQLLDMVPTYILSDPLLAGFRTLLAPPVVKRNPKRDVDRSQEYEWLRTHMHEHRGRWVALVGGNLVASAATLRELQERLRAMSLPGPPLLDRVD